MWQIFELFLLFSLYRVTFCFARACALALVEAASVSLLHAYVTLGYGNYADVFHLLDYISCVSGEGVKVPAYIDLELAF